MKQISILSLFPEMLDEASRYSILGRAREEGHVQVTFWNIRDYAEGAYRKVDDVLYGGGRGMLMMCEPIWKALQAAEQHMQTAKPRRIFLSPKGRVLNQSYVRDLAQSEALVLLCGHYEGVDQRLLDEANFEELSIGDYVLTGGELPALVLLDALVRMHPDVLSQEATQEESHYATRLESKHFTKPQIWHDRQVPSVLLSGHHAKIEMYRKYSSWAETLKKRPDLFAHLDLNAEEREALLHFMEMDEEI